MATQVQEYVTLRPLFDNVVILPDPPDALSFGGIHLPESKDAPTRGTVLAIGPGGHAVDGFVIPMSVKAGERVLLSRYGGAEIRHNGQTLRIVREKDIVAVLE